jgi:hypothetical protein
MALRSWGRVYDVNGNPTWVAVTTTPSGDDSLVWLTTLIQTLQGILEESPFHADRGIPAVPSVLTQIPPDFYAAYTQSLFAQYFASLIIYRVPTTPASGYTVGVPTYQVNVITKQGAILPPVHVPTLVPH